MHIRHEIEGSGGGFYVDDKKKIVAELTYTREDDVMNIHHTLVDGDREGEGIGRKLVDAAVEFAREKSLRILPTCSFARGVVEKHHRDLLAALS